jgi:hypothetical protein
MVDSLAAKIGIGEAARRDPVGVRVRFPYKRRLRTIPYPHKGRSTKDAKPPRTVGFRIPKLVNALTVGEIEDAPRILPYVAQGRCRDSLFYDLSGLTAGVTWLTLHLDIKGLRHLACPEKSGQDRPVNDDVVPPSYHPAVSRSGYPGRFHPDAAARDPIPRLARGVGLIVVLLLSAGLWGAIWLAVSALAAVSPL